MTAKKKGINLENLSLGLGVGDLCKELYIEFLCV